MLKSGIYCIRHLSTGKCYVGQSVDIQERLNQHIRLKDDSYIERAIKKHGVDAFAFEILELCEESNLNQREIHWIASLDCVSPNGFNLSHGGKGGGRRSQKSRLRMSEAQTGENNPNYGKTFSVEHRRKISEAQKGKRTGEQHHSYGKTPSPQARKKMSNAKSGENHPMYGKDFSPEHRRKISESSKGRTVSPKSRAKISQTLKGHKVSSETRAKISVSLKRKSRERACHE